MVSGSEADPAKLRVREDSINMKLCGVWVDIIRNMIAYSAT